MVVGRAFADSTEAYVVEADGTAAVVKLLIPRGPEVATHEMTALRLTTERHPRMQHRGSYIWSVRHHGLNGDRTGGPRALRAVVRDGLRSRRRRRRGHCSAKMAAISAMGSRTTGPVTSTSARPMLPLNANGAS